MRNLRGPGFPFVSAPGADRGFAPRAAISQLVLRHLALQGIAMYPQELAGRRPFASTPFQRALNHLPFQQLDGLLQKNIAVQQMLYQGIEFLFHYFLSASGAV